MDPGGEPSDPDRNDNCYRGIFDPNTKYYLNNIVLYNNSLYVCNQVSAHDGEPIDYQYTIHAIPPIDENEGYQVWKKIKAFGVYGNLQFDQDSEWIKLKCDSDFKSSNKFIEYKFVPNYGINEFDTVQIKIEMYSFDEINVPYIKNIRLITLA